MIARTAWLGVALGLALQPLVSHAENERPLTATQKRVLDGTYLYLMASQYCDPAPDAHALSNWIRQELQRNGLGNRTASAYFDENLSRLDTIADATFTGRHRQALCEQIRAAVTGGQKDRPKPRSD